MPQPDYKTNDPRGWCGDPSRGAALGRPSVGVPPRGATSDFDGELTLRHIHIDSGGYDPNGTYFGSGEPLYWFASDDGEIDSVLRASDREDAESLVLALYPRARFRKFLDLDTFFAAYIECALWSSTDQADEPLDANYNECDLTPEALASLRKEAEAFATEEVVAPLIMGHESQAGHDFWLTRNGHGCGFWDGDWPKRAGEILTARSRAYRESYIYVGDDKKLHV